MNWHEYIDIYCERVDSTFWAEPLNALSNFAFIFASLLLFRLYFKSKLQSYPFLFLSTLLFLIGIGSFLFHTYANIWSQYADTVPIWSFVLFYILFSARIVFEASWTNTLKVIAVVLSFVYIGFDLSNSMNLENDLSLNGSIQYAPALFLLGVFSFLLYLKKSASYKYGFYALGIFILSLFFRTADMNLCESIGVGTHFIWHILNAWMLYYLLYIVFLSLKKD